MVISKEEIRLVQSCWSSISSYSSSIIADFYPELFKRFPHYRQYFTTDQATQAEKLISMINIFINGLEVWEKIEPELIKLGEYHAGIADFTAQDYENVTNTLTWAMCRYRDNDEEDSETMNAWNKIFTVVSQTMLKAQFSEKKYKEITG